MRCPECGSWQNGDARVCTSCGFSNRYRSCGSCEYFARDTDCDGPGGDDACIQHCDSNVWSSKTACIHYYPEICD